MLGLGNIGNLIARVRLACSYLTIDAYTQMTYIWVILLVSIIPYILIIII